MKLSLTATIFLCVVGALVVFSVSTNSRNSILVKEFIYVAAGVIAGIALGFLVLSGKKFHLYRIPAMAAVSLVLIATLMLIVHFTGPVKSVNGPFTMMSFAALCLLALLGVAVIDHKHLSSLAIFLTVVSSVLFLYALLQSFGVVLFPWDAGLTRSGRSSGSLGNPNLLGAFAAAMVPFGAATILSLVRKGWFRVLLSALYCGIAVSALTVSGTRGSLLGLFGGVLFLGVWLFRRMPMSRRGKLLLILGFVLVSLLAVLPMRHRIQELSNDGSESGTAQVRRIIWSGGLDMFRERPVLGWGPGSFQIVFPAYRNPRYSILGVSHNTLHAHCEYLEILCDIGLVGLFVFGLFALGMARRVRGAGLIGAGAAAGAVSMLSENLVSVSLRWPPTAWLFSLLCMVFLIREGRALHFSRKGLRLFSGIGLTLSALVLGVFAVRAYPAALEAARLVFSGKDVHLTATETPMNAAAHYARTFVTTGDRSAATAAANAWLTATAHADSAISICSRASSTDRGDLSALYALGSAYLTRAILAAPLDMNISQALIQSGLSSPDPAAARRYNELGMETYAALSALAPNYAETHNNMAIGYLALGDVYGSLDELHRAWLLHGHRRSDYFGQAVRLMRVAPDSRGAAGLIWDHLLDELLTARNDGMELKVQRKLESLTDIRWFFMIYDDPSGSREDELRRAADSCAPWVMRSLDSITLANPLPDALADSGLSLMGAGRYPEALAVLERLHDTQNSSGPFLPTAWPGLGAGYMAVGEAAHHLQWSHENAEAMFRQMVHLYRADMIAAASLDVAFGSLSASVRPGVTDSLMTVSNNVGGPRAAARAGSPKPWLAGSMLDAMESSLRALCQQNPSDPSCHLLMTRFYYLAVTSLWWDSQFFTPEQNRYLLGELFTSRDCVAALMGSGANAALSRALDGELERVMVHVDSRNLSVLEELKSDLADMVPRYSQ
ncbi:MAG: O-antigen ligase family protein [Candidatus Fermentibacteraceae bacterium]